MGIGGLACLLFLYGASVLFLPWWAIVLLGVLWVLLVVRATRWFTPRPVATALLPLLGFVVWLAAVALAAWG